MSTADTLFQGVLPFFRVAEERSYRRAAQRLGVTAAAVSKAVLKLEDELGVKLLVRTSRSVALTPEGELFAARCRDAISSVQAGRELIVESQRQPSGEVKLTVPFILGRIVTQGLGALAARYPQLSFRVSATDRLVRLAEEGVDVAVRIGALTDSSLISRPLRGSRWVTVASPTYLAQRGAPRRPDQLDEHRCLQFLAPDGRPRDWSFVDPKSRAMVTAKVRARLLVDQGEHLLEAAASGQGIAQVLDFMVTEHVSSGRLVEVLELWAAQGPAIHALATPERSRAAAVRVLLDHLGDTLRRGSAERVR